ERAWEPGDVSDWSEEVASRELGAGVDLARRVARREHEVRLARDLVQLPHRVPGEVLGHGLLDRLEVVVGSGVLRELRPIAADERVRVDVTFCGDEAGEGGQAPGASPARAWPRHYPPVHRPPHVP